MEEKRKRGRPKKYPDGVKKREPTGGKRGRPKKDPNDLKPKKEPTGGMAGRPRKEKTEEDLKRDEKTSYHSTPIERKVSIGKTWLGMYSYELTKEELNKFTREIEKTPIGDFSGTGFDIYKRIYNEILGRKKNSHKDTGEG